MLNLQSELNDFFTELDKKSSNNINTFQNVLSQCHEDPKNQMFIKFLKKWNKESFKETWTLFVNFCAKYNIDLSILNKLEIKDFKKRSFSKVFINTPDGYNTLKAIAGRAVYWMKITNKTVTPEIIYILVINTINQYCHIGKFLENCILDKSELERYFWTSKKIALMVKEIIDIMENDFIDIKDNTNNFGKTIGFELPEMTREWLIETIGDEKSYSKAINKIRQRNPVSRRAIQWAIEKTGVDKELNLVRRQYKSKEETTPAVEVSITAVKETKPETGIQVKSDIEDYNPFLSGPANSIIEEEKKSTFTDEDMELLDNLLNK